MFELKVRLISILGFLAILVIAGLALDYCGLCRRPVRFGLIAACAGIVAGIVFTLTAVTPDNDFYGAVFSEAKTTKRVVALTFDDGPNPPYTNQILDILKEYHVRATFFLIGQNVERYPEVAKRIAAEGHQLGNHTYSHIDLLQADRKVIEEEVDRANRVIKHYTGQTPHVVRPPHGFRDAVVLDVMASRGLRVVEWSVSCRDWTNPGTALIVERVLSQVRSGSIILLHDGDGIAGALPRAQTVEATRIIVRELLKRGYEFVTVDEILPAARRPLLGRGSEEE